MPRGCGDDGQSGIVVCARGRQRADVAGEAVRGLGDGAEEAADGRTRCSGVSAAAAAAGVGVHVVVVVVVRSGGSSSGSGSIDDGFWFGGGGGGVKDADLLLVLVVVGEAEDLEAVLGDGDAHAAEEVVVEVGDVVGVELVAGEEGGVLVHEGRVQGARFRQP